MIFSKCFFCQEKVDLLGNVVRKDGLLVDPKKVDEISKKPRLTTTMELRSFLVLCGYYRRFIKGFSDTSSSLNAATPTLRDFEWIE